MSKEENEESKYYLILLDYTRLNLLEYKINLPKYLCAKRDRNVLPLYTCNRCNEIAIEPKMCKNCSTLICQSCIDKITNIPEEMKEPPIKCNECKSVLNLSEINKNTKKGLENLNVKCPSKNKNCLDEHKLKDISKHLEICKFWEGKSKCNSCGLIESLSNIKKHIDVCKDLLIKCNYCDIFFKRKEITKHEYTSCINKPTNCKTCNIKYDKENTKIIMNDHPSKDSCMEYLVTELAKKLEGNK